MTSYRSAPLQTRHRLVYEIGDAGVARLCDSHVTLRVSGEAGDWAADYLTRAGVSVTRAGDGGPTGEPPAEAALRGALEAVEIIKETLGLGARGSVPDAMREATSRE